MTLPAAGYFTDKDRINPEAKQAHDDTLEVLREFDEKGITGADRGYQRLAKLELDGSGTTGQIKCTLTDMWGGDSISQTAVSKDGTSGHFSLSSGGDKITIDSSGLSGDVLMVGWVGMRPNAGTAGSGLTIEPKVSGGDIVLQFGLDAGGVPNLDVELGPSGWMPVHLLYVTDS